MGVAASVQSHDRHDARSAGDQAAGSVRSSAALTLDELPEPVKLDASFGAYKAEWSYENGTLTFVHELEIRDAVVPAAHYLGVRKFFEAVASAQASAVVLLNR